MPCSDWLKSDTPPVLFLLGRLWDIWYESTKSPNATLFKNISFVKVSDSVTLVAAVCLRSCSLQFYYKLLLLLER